MRHYMVDPDNEERLLKIPPHVVAAIKGEALDAAREAVAASWKGWCDDPTTCTDYEHVCGERRNTLAAIDALKEQR